eukprot:3971576-Amphidinium_carterae.1
MALVIGNILLLMFLRHSFRTHFKFGRVVFQIITAAAVEIVNTMITKVVEWLTQRENHRTQTEFETSFLIKTLIAKFINSFSALYYMAFFKDHGSLLGEEMECGKNRLGDEDCLLDLQAQLGVFVIFHLVVQNMFEVAIPYLKEQYRSMNFSLYENPA